MDTQPFIAQHYRDDNKFHILLAASGSVATIKLPNITAALCQNERVSVRIIVTEASENFLLNQSSEQPILDSLREINGVDGIYRDQDEWSPPWTRGGPVLHIELRKWAHLLLVAPMSANTMAKMVNGIADNLLLSTIRAWDTTGCVDKEFKKLTPRIFVAPSMNTAMMIHPVTKKQLKVLRDEWGWSESNPQGWVTVLPPIEKNLACGDVGSGGMMEWKDIVLVIQDYITWAQKP
ncbi:unnamed protein product [Penicillium salamii]|uniref:Flavoprotein domain-containing protein n=1 Tax=Penicillium salamii TaxID=1612424 RepID=A0A9W4JLF7_9EURO|nr:unnamed protein product [Penicillium salamii]CAG8102184.1 unnamed protein product [Penicillium salamii]CAG8136541.1 unnamed protein product [Penicillium salamii]CAG8146073.1 unnamed protein product [Penicillium salamii]CAG8181250.1 unnamed protein product [Penicillium salamii]